MKNLYFLLFLLLLSPYAFGQFPSFQATYKSHLDAKKSLKPDFDSIEKEIPDFKDDIRLLDSMTELDVPFAFLIGEKIKSDRDSLNDKINSLEAMFTQDCTYSELLAYNNELVRLRKTSTNLKQLSDYYYTVNRLAGRPTLAAAFIPIRNESDAKFFFHGIKATQINSLNNLVIQGSSNRGVISSDLVSGILGPSKITFNSVFYSSNTDSTDQQEINTKVFNGGGLTNLRVELPFYYFQRKNLILYAAIKPGYMADFPILGSEIPKNTFIGYLDLPLEFFTQIKPSGGDFSLFANLKLSKISGNSHFYNNLNYREGTSVEDQNTSFYMSQIYAGISITDGFKLTMNIPLASSNGVEIPENVTVGLQITPTKKSEN